MQEESIYNFGVRGYIKPGFEPLLRKFEELHKNGNDTNSQLCVYVGDTIYVDLYSNKTTKFNADTPIFLWSSGKSVGNILMGIQRDRGLIEYDKPVC